MARDPARPRLRLTPLRRPSDRPRKESENSDASSRRAFTRRCAQRSRLAASFSRPRVRPGARRPCRPRLPRSALMAKRTALFQPARHDARPDHARRLLDHARFRFRQCRRAAADHSRYAVSDRLDQQGDDRRPAPSVRRRRAVSADRPDERPAARHPAAAPATRSRSSICSTMSRACPATRRCSRTAGCGPLIRRARIGIIRTPLTKCSASSPSISAASRSAGCSHERMFAPARHAPQPRRDHRRRPHSLRPGLRGRRSDASRSRAACRSRRRAWVDVTFGAGSVASTADDMNRFLRIARRRRSGPRRARPSPAAGAAFTDPCGAERHRPG